jgi:hypothetical protein
MRGRQRTHISPESAAGQAAWLNASMGVSQIAASVVTGNLGFIGESVHNIGDGLSFEAKRRAIVEKDEMRSRRIRSFAARVFAVGGGFGVGAGAYEIVSRHAENTSYSAVAIAVGGAAINTIIAKRTHRAVVNQETGEVHAMCDHEHHHDHASHHHDHGHHSHEEPTQNTAALIDTRLHAMSDAGTGWVYVGGLLAQKWGIHDAASFAVLANGVISSLSACFTLRRIKKS